MRTLMPITLALTTLLVCSCARDKAAPLPAKESCGSVSFSMQVEPLIMDKCSGCHSSGYLCGELRDYSTVKIKADDGTLTDKVEKKLMPPSNPLSEEEIRMIQCWVADGAKNN